MTQTFDITIIGGGIVGSTLACLLNQQSNLNIAIIEKQLPDFDWDNRQYDPRVSAIIPGSQKLFQHLDVWQDILNERVGPFQQMFVWDGCGDGSIQFDCDAISQPNLGHLIENRVMRQALFNKINHSNITLITEKTCRTLHPHEDSVDITFDDNSAINTKLLIGADGANSWVRQHSDIELTEKPYDHHAIVCTVTHEHSHQHTAWQCFTEHGPIAFLPLDDTHTSSIVWSTKPNIAQQLMEANDQDFLQELTQEFEHKLGQVITTSKRYSFPLIRRKAKDYVKPNIALVGDAAHTIHPLAGQGLNLGLMDAASLAEIILDNIEQQLPINDWQSLCRYQRWRKSETLLMMQAMDEFKRLFTNQRGLVQIIRNAGLKLMNRSGPIKHAIIERAMGLSGDLPKALR